MRIGVQAGTTSDVIPDAATLILNLRTYIDATRTAMLDLLGYFGDRAGGLPRQTASDAWP